MDERPDKPPEANQPSIQPESLLSPVTLQPIRRSLPLYTLTDAEIDQVASVSTTLAVNLAFLGIGVGAMIAFLIAIKSAQLETSTVSLFWLGFWGGAILTAYCGLQVGLGYWQQANRVRQLKARG